MDGFLGGDDSRITRGLLEDPTPQPQDTAPDLDSILADAGAERVKSVMQAIIGQESNGNPNVGASVDGAQGIGQMMPDTFRRFAKPGERIDNPSDNLRASARFINYLYDRAGGDPAKIAAGYFSGEGNIGKERAYKTDHKDGNGKTVSGYVADVLGRMGQDQGQSQVANPFDNGAAAPAAPASGAPAPRWSEVTQRASFKSLTPAERDLARSEYFNRYVAPKVGADERDAAKAAFLEQSKTLDPKEPGLLDRAWDTLGSARQAIREFAGTTDEQRAAKRAPAAPAIDPSLGVMGKPLAPAPKSKLADLPVDPEYLRRVSADWNGGTPAQRKSMETMPGYRGYIAKQLNAQYADHKPTATTDLLDPRAEARARRLVAGGLNGDIAANVARDAAFRDIAPGAESGTDKATVSTFDFDARKKFNEDPFFSHPLVRGAVKGYQGYKTGSLGVAQFAADALGAKDFAGAMAEGTAESRAFTDAMGTPTDGLQRNFEGAISSIAQQLPAMIGGAATGSEALVLGSMFAQTFGQEYTDGRSRGQSIADATKRAGLFGSFEVIGEKFGLKYQMDAMRQASKGVTTDLLAGWLGNMVKKELPGEMLTTTGQFGTDKLPGIGLHQDANFGDYLDQMSDTVVQTMIQGGIMGGSVNGVAHAVNYMNQGGQKSEGSQALDADIARANALAKWEDGGLTNKGNGRIEPKLDAHAAGLTPAQRAVDQRARDAFADLVEPEQGAAPTLLDDEIPASMLLGQEESAPEKVAEPDAMPDTAPIGEQPAPAPVPAKKGKMTSLEHPALQDVELRGELAHMVSEAGWDQVGGKMIREDATDGTSKVVGRTPWIPKQAWYAAMPERLNEADTELAVGKALAGEPMTAKEKRVVANMLEMAQASVAEREAWTRQVHDEVGATSTEEYHDITAHADTLEEQDADIPFALDDPRVTKSDNLSNEDIDELFGIKQKSRVPENTAPGNAGEGTQGSGTPAAAGSGAGFQLQGETRAEALKKLHENDSRLAAERKARLAQEAKEKEEANAKDIKARQAASAENFKLGESAEDSLSGQQDLLAAKPKTEKQASAQRKAAKAQEPTPAPADKNADLSTMFDDLMAEEGAATPGKKPAAKSEKPVKPKTEKAAKAAKAKKVAEKAAVPAVADKNADLGAMFDDLIAEEAGTAAPAGSKPAHAQTAKEHRKAPDRGNKGPFAFHKAADKLDSLTVESLLKDYRKDVPALGMMLGAKGGKNVPKMATDIMRIWNLRGELATATVDSLMEKKGAELKELAKRVGVYANTNKSTLASGIIQWRDEQRTKAADRLQDAKHLAAVSKELEAGRKVAASVIADYPYLAVEHYARGTPEYNAGIKALAETAKAGVVGMDHPAVAEAYRKANATAKGKEADINADVADAIDGKPAPRGAGEAAVSAVKNAATGLANAIDGLGALFGDKPGGGTLGSGPVFNEETYAQAKPLFQAAITNFNDAAADIKDVMRAVIRMVSDKFGIETAGKMKPYIVRFIADYREGITDAPTTGRSAEQAGAHHQDEKLGRDSAVHDGSTATGSNDRGAVGQAGKRGNRPAADLVVHDSGAPAGGAGRSDGISVADGKLRLDRIGAEPGDATGSGATGTGGTAATDSGADGHVSEHDGRSDVAVSKTFAEKVEAQKAAHALPVKLGDRANIDATLPLLLEGQREDVHFAEKRLMQPKGYGVLFANGTGTGKTYLSLGIIKRMIASGKKNGTVVVPNKEVMAEWLASAPNLGIELHTLADKKDAGKGVAITTYANFGDNLTLLDRPQDFVVADEAHNLMANKTADDTLALATLRAITLHPDSAYQRTNMLHRDLVEKIDVLRRELAAIRSDADGTMTRAGTARLAEIEEELTPLERKFSKALEEQRELVKAVQPEARPRLVAVSATPFAWEKNTRWAHGYLFDFPVAREVGSYNAPGPYEKFMMQNFGWRMRTNRLTEPDEKVDRALMQIQFNMRLRKEGVLSTRMLDVERDYDRKFLLVDGGIGARIDQALKWLRESKDGIYRQFYDEADAQFDYLTKSRLLEAIKAKAAIDVIKGHHALGRKVVVFHDFNQGGGFAPFNFVGDRSHIVKATVGHGVGAREVTFSRGEFIDDFAKNFPELMGDELAKLKSPIETLKEAFPGALFNNGLPEHKKGSLAAIKAFNDDANAAANLLVVQSSKNAGWSGHDRSGKFMRVSLNLGLPTAPVKGIQLEGRTYRTGQMSDAPMRYMNTGTMFERIAFATSIAGRAEAAENLAMGDFARGLKKSFIEAFENSDVYPAGPSDGQGGKAQDRRTAAMSDFDRAKSYYFAQEKKTARNKAAEGADYFATPEPIGLKMVEWLQPKKGEALLEPSGGHGAIARWFPEGSSYKVIEPSMELASRLSLVVDPRSIINDDFETHHIGNKYDGIAMNPPFGTGGKLAMEHVAKAFGHLREGGRIVAIIPDGPAMDKRLNDWLTATQTNARGATSLVNPDVRLTTYVTLPASAFARAGTQVRTRIVVIDRVKGGNDGTGQAVEPASTRAGRGEFDINQVFDYIKDLQMPARPVAAAAPAMPATAASAPGVTLHAHGRVIDDASKAVFNIVGDKLETDAPVEKVTVNSGKVVDVVMVPSRDMAFQVDRFTWKPKGQDKYVVRMRHVIRPQGTSFSLAPGYQSGGVADGAKNGTSISQADADHTVGRVLAGLKGRVQGVTITTVENFAGLPSEILQDAQSQGVDGGVLGAYLDGRIYLVRGEHATTESFEETIFHELYGHAGLNKVFGANITTALDQLYRNVGGLKGLEKIAAQYNVDLSRYYGTIYNNDSYSHEMRRRLMMEELLAHIAEQGPSFKQKVKEVVGTVKFRLRKLGFDSLTAKLGAYDAADLARVLANVRNALMDAAPVGETGNATANARAARRAQFSLAPRAPMGAAPAVAPKLGLLDTPMRLAMQKTGALAVWRGAFRLLEKTASAALNNKVGEIIKAGLIDRYGLSDAVIERHEEMRVQMIKGVRTADRFLERLRGLSRAEYAVLYAAANNADTAAVNDMIKDLPEDSQAALHEIKTLVRDLGQEAVDLKMLDVDTFKANELAYLHRSYLKHEADLTVGEQSNRAIRIKGDQFKMRGLADIVSSDRLMGWMPEFWGTRVKNGAVTSGTVGQSFIRFERRADVSPTPNLPGIEGAPALGRLKEVVYWPVGEETPAKFADWHNEGEWTVRRTVGKNVVFRRDFTKAERQRMGEIDDIRYAMAKTLNIAVHDVEVGKYFAWLAEGHAKLPGDTPAGATLIDEPRRAESKLQTFTKDMWVKVPDVKVAGTGVAAYGKLAGRYIPGPIWADIRSINSGSFFDSQAGKTYEKLLRMWKISKTALSPAVHVNNVMANVVMADWHDVSGTHLLKATVAWARQGKSADHKQLVQDFQDNGGELGTYALTEMQQSQLAPILDELLASTREQNDMNGLVNATQVINLLREGMVRQAAATFGQSKAARGASAIPGKMIDVYQMEDQIFRLASFIKARESGLTDRQAGRYARRSFLDYNIQAPWIVAAKQSGVLPFISFSYRAIPMLYETMRDKPWKIMKLAMVLGAASAASAAFLGLSDDDEERERRWLPDEKRGTIWGMVPKMIRMPWNTASDNPVFLDVRRFIPAGDITDTGTSHGALPLPGFLSVGGPLALMVELMANRSMFTGKDIVLDTDTPAESTKKILDYTYKWAMPNLPVPTLGTITPGTEPGQFQTYSWTGISNAAHRKEGTFGRDQNIPMAVGSAFGMKLEGYSPAVGRKNAEAKHKAGLQELRKQEGAVGRQRRQGGIDAEEYKRRMEHIREKKAKESREFGQRAAGKPSPGLADLMR